MTRTALMQHASDRALEYKDAPEGEAKDIASQLAKAFEEFKAANDDQIKEIKKGLKDVVSEDKITRISDALDKLQAAKDAAEKKAQDRLDEVEKRLGRMRLAVAGDATNDDEKKLARFNSELKSFSPQGRPTPAAHSFDEMKAYCEGYLKWAKGGDRALSAEEQKAMTAGTDSEGGYLVTPDMSGRIVTKIFETSPVRQVAAVQQISTSELDGVYDIDEATSGGWVSETGTRAATAAPTVGKYVIQVHEAYVMPEVTQKLLDDAAINVEQWLADKIADKLTRVQNAAFVNGTGVGQPRGFTTYTLAATSDASRTWGQIEKVKTGANGDFAATNPADKIFDLIAAFKSGYLDNGTFATTREVIAKIRKFKEATTNAYIWQPGLQKGQPEQLLGYGVMKMQDLAALGTGTASLWLADWSQAYQIVDRIGFRTLRDPYTNKPYVRFYTTARVGGAVVQFEAIKAMTFET